jgi:hypothetical protein
MERLYVLVAGGSQGENLIIMDVRQQRLGVVTLLKVSCLEPRH